MQGSQTYQATRRSKKAHRSHHIHIEWARTLVVRHFNDVTSFVCELWMYVFLYVNRKRKDKLCTIGTIRIYTSIHYTPGCMFSMCTKKTKTLLILHRMWRHHCNKNHLYIVWQTVGFFFKFTAWQTNTNTFSLTCGP